TFARASSWSAWRSEDSKSRLIVALPTSGANASPGPLQKLGHVALRQGEGRGDFFLALAVEKLHAERYPLPRRQRGQSGKGAPRILQAGGGELRRDWRGSGRPASAAPGKQRALAAVARDRHVGGHAVQPAAQIGVTIELGPVLEETHEHVVHGIFSAGPIAGGVAQTPAKHAVPMRLVTGG